MGKKMTKRQQRTQDVIDTYRGLPGEFYMLKGLLCLDAAVSTPAEKRDGWQAGSRERKRVDGLLDGLMIATRMDEVNAEVRATALKAA